MSRELFGSVVTAMVTPFTSDGDLDLDAAQVLASHLVDTGTTTVLVHGTTGESPTLRGSEPWQVLGAVKDAVGERAAVMMGTGSNDGDHAVAQTEHAAEAGADGVLVVTPYYNRPSQRMLVAHFTRVADASELPVVLYDVPSRTATEISLDVIVELSAHDRIVGIKDAVADLGKTADIVAATRRDSFEVWCGSDEVNLAALAVGAVGYVSVTSHLAGSLLAQMAALFPTDPAAARDIHLSLMPLHRALFVESNPAPLKGALARLGIIDGALRGPLLPALDATVDDVMAAMEHAGISTT